MDFPYYSPLLKNTCFSQVVLDKWLPMIAAAVVDDNDAARVVVAGVVVVVWQW